MDLGVTSTCSLNKVIDNYLNWQISIRPDMSDLRGTHDHLDLLDRRKEADKATHLAVNLDCAALKQEQQI